MARPARRALDELLTEAEFKAGVRSIRGSIAAGDVYQVNLTRRLSAPCRGAATWPPSAPPGRGQPGAVQRRRARARPGCLVASASPERFLWRDGDLVESGPIKGTAPDPTA